MLFQHWGQELDSEVTNDLLFQLSYQHARDITSATIREYFLASITSRDIPALCDYDISYADISVADAIHVRQIAAFFSKRSDLELGSVSKRDSAVRKFIESEVMCSKTNDLFSKHLSGLVSFPKDVESLLFAAQRKIAKILGPVPKLSELKLRFGPGATTQVKKRDASVSKKLTASLSCSKNMLPVIQSVFAEIPSWVEFNILDPDGGIVNLEVSPGKLVFVPKNAKTYRSVIVEPSLNSFVQLGINDHIVSRLKRFGLDLTDQSRNQRLAREGSLTGALATLDLSSASDTIALLLVWHLLPMEWADFLSNFRTSIVEYEGETVELEKFSSMGNGFTFPLESLIFYALSLAAAEDDNRVSVYGDDIIVPTEYAERLTMLLTFCGFQLNQEKSFVTGPFRESCGKDYLSGIDIRPCYIKQPLAGYSLYVLHNFYVRTSRDDLALFLRSFLDKSLLRFGPDGYGDGHLLGDHLISAYGRDRGWSGYTFESYRFRSRKFIKTLPGDRVYPFYHSYVSSIPGIDWRKLMAGVLTGNRVELPEFSSLPFSYKNGIPVHTVPGKHGYDLIKIYTLSPSS